MYGNTEVVPQSWEYAYQMSLLVKLCFIMGEMEFPVSALSYDHENSNLVTKLMYTFQNIFKFPSDPKIKDRLTPVKLMIYLQEITEQHPITQIVVPLFSYEQKIG